MAPWGHLFLKEGSFGLVEALRGGILGAQGGPKEESREASASLERIWVPPKGSNFSPGAPMGAPKSPKMFKRPSLITSICVYDNISFFLENMQVSEVQEGPSGRPIPFEEGF